MTTLDELISTLEGGAPVLTTTIIERLREIKDETFKTDKPTKQQYTQSGRLADELSLPLNFGDWLLTTYDISATVEEPPTLTAEYRFIQGTKK